MKSLEQIQTEKAHLLAELAAREQEIKEARREERRKRLENEARLQDEHRAMMSERYGVPRGDWFDRAYWIAWQHGHSAGFSDIEGYFSEIAELYQIER